MSQSQKVHFLETKQGKFMVSTHPVPRPAADQVLLSIAYLGIYLEMYPAVLGTEGAGEAELGENVNGFSKGYFPSNGLSWRSPSISAIRYWRCYKDSGEAHLLPGGYDFFLATLTAGSNLLDA
ncbi:hypothetical protein BT96DRAFT_973897 [Gymnopus androsaceus JB14]|uniref:Uncharacterized protein n=1 Tax=Gymnopus androsaceus JB14 TaxID=1447944 RepID=A0A6A4I120_9AGAR|nr:hypothetical protein BT96DRAFT_973897 [Gymnopus androsaceus JB14]